MATKIKYILTLVLVLICVANCTAPTPGIDKETVIATQPPASTSTLSPTRAPGHASTVTPTVGAIDTPTDRPTDVPLGLTAITPAPHSVLSPLPDTFPKIDRLPAPADWGRGARGSVPSYDPDSLEYWQVDLRSYDLSRLDLTDRLDDLMHASFDSQTKWPLMDKMPIGFDPHQIAKLGKNPGLGIRHLHERGVTGHGIGIAIVDQTLLVGHQEYADRLRLYEETDDIQGGWLMTQMHGPAVASIAVGKTVGVAPDADLYYIATARGGQGDDFGYLARSIHRILEVNRQLPEDRKIRAIAMAIGWDSEVKGYDELEAAVEEAKGCGMLVICSSVERIHGFGFLGMGRSPTEDADSFESYEPGWFWAQAFYSGDLDIRAGQSSRLLVPMDSRTTASPGGVDEYVFYRHGGWSWSIPYIAGLYALAAQVDSDITPNRFWTLAMETGGTIVLDHGGQEIAFGPIVDPVALIAALQAQEAR